jgi:hypothetical protein
MGNDAFVYVMHPKCFDACPYRMAMMAAMKKVLSPSSDTTITAKDEINACANEWAWGTSVACIFDIERCVHRRNDDIKSESQANKRKDRHTERKTPNRQFDSQKNRQTDQRTGICMHSTSRQTSI